MKEIYIYKCEKCKQEFERNQRIENGTHTGNCNGTVKFIKIKEHEIVKSSKMVEGEVSLEDFKELSTTVF